MAKGDARARRGSDKQKANPDQDKPSVYPRALMTRGSEASDRWLTALGLPRVPRWHVEISIDADNDTSFELNIYAEEWGFAFHRGSRGTWIRVTDIPFVHGRDDFKLLARTPDLFAIKALATDLEQEHGISFRRGDATIRTNIPDATEIVRAWIAEH